MAPNAELKVYISGAIRNPGVYAVDQGDRLGQVIEAAGGATGDADLTAVNLAARVEDEDHWHIPRQGEAAGVPAPAQCPAAGKVDLNSAPVEKLMELDGVGEALSQRIVDYTEANGPFSSVDELDQVSGIGPTILGNNRDSIVVCR